MLIKCTNRGWTGDLRRRQAQCAQEPGGVRPGAVRPGAVRPGPGAARNNRDLNAASIQISRESIIDKNGAVSQSILMVRQYQISRESIIDKNGAIRLLTEPCSSYRLLNVPAANITGRNLGHAALRSEPALSQGSIERGATRQVAENPHDKQQ
ncbi:hypothetical protein L2E82_29777 [Cichorium intybus]|uniref:Uncharacterized protein n=1 Tax=Cichorium intybus TaxID=13427 RepID=A0ACB9CYF2_CICIN|nr:hypothetical protein L2E82_29777 [Cichorium intybus]